MNSRPGEGAFRAIRRGILAQSEAQSSRAGTEALSVIPDAVLGWRESGAAARQPTVLSAPLSRDTALRVLLRLPLPDVSVPRVLGPGDFALRRGQVYATVLIDAETGQRVDVLDGRKAAVLEAWLRSNPGVEVVPGTGPAPAGRRSAGRCPARSRPVTAGTCGTAWPRPS